MKESEMLARGSVGVILTDTIYGIVAAASNEAAVRCVYTLKGRTPTKPCIILLSTIEELTSFGIVLTEAQEKILSRYWPGPVSIIMPCGIDVPDYLHRGTHTLAFRIPNNEALRSFLRESGPLIAPSANPEGLPPATTIEEAKQYFGNECDFYVDGGKLVGEPSTLISLDDQGTITVLREGSVSVN